MDVNKTSVADVLILTPKVYEDERGTFAETFNDSKFQAEIGGDFHFVQDNQSVSCHGVLRGLHLQSRTPQGKLIRVIDGEIYDVFIDCRHESSSTGQHGGILLTAESYQQIWIPPGFAHGFLTLSETATIQYKVTDYYDPGFELTLAWDDPVLQIDWPFTSGPYLSKKDLEGLDFQSILDALSSEH